MKLERRNSWDDRQYLCSLTKELDNNMGLPKVRESSFENYLYDVRDSSCNCFAIRVPGRTTGEVEIDENNMITRCEISSNVIGNGKFYPEEVNEKIQKYVGVLIEL